MATSRRLSAIMFTDMVGYTARTQADERGTLELLKEQERVVGPILDAHRGRTVKSTGDGYLVEFPSALQATQCAVAIQERLRERNRSTSSPAIELRIGIHLGDVEERGSDIFGDAVNIASRVQPTADPGGIAVSQQVFDQIRNKVPFALEKLEPRSLKGVQFPMDIYRVRFTEGPGPGLAAPSPTSTNRIAVLPFANISPDPHDAYLSDGLTEEVITVLSQISELRVIARTSVEPYRAAPKPIPQVASELGVGWVLEGSVRKAGSRLRITAQLIDARSQEHAWAETYDRDLDDVFAMQSEMAKKVAGALRVKLLAREEVRIGRRPRPNPESYLEYLQGRAGLHGIEEGSLRNALAHFERAIAIDERNAAAHAGLSDVHALLGGLYQHLPKEEWTAECQRHARRAIELDPDLAEAHTALAFIVIARDGFAAAEAEFVRAIELNPSFAWAHQWYAPLLADMGRPEEALREFELAEQLDPLSALVLAEEVPLLIALRRLDRAKAQLERLGVVEGNGILYTDRKADLALAEGDLAEYRRCIDRMAELLPGRPELRGGDAVLAALSGQPEEARAIARELEELPEATRPDSQIANVYATLGDVDRCLERLAIAVDLNRFPPRVWRYEPRYENVRRDPRFGELLRRMKIG